MKGHLCLILLMLPASAGVVSAQSVGVHAAGGPTFGERGWSVAAGVDLSPTSYLGFVFNFERTHVESRLTREGGVTSRFRGATLTLGTAELRLTAFPSRRVRPFGLCGMGAGNARPNVDEIFPGGGTTGGVRAVFFGGGLHLAVRERLSVFTEVRMMLVGETEGEGLLGIGPVRAGLAWRF